MASPSRRSLVLSRANGHSTFDSPARQRTKKSSSVYSTPSADSTVSPGTPLEISGRNRMLSSKALRSAIPGLQDSDPVVGRTTTNVQRTGLTRSERRRRMPVSSSMSSLLPATAPRRRRENRRRTYTPGTAVSSQISLSPSFRSLLGSSAANGGAANSKTPPRAARKARTTRSRPQSSMGLRRAKSSVLLRSESAPTMRRSSSSSSLLGGKTGKPKRRFSGLHRSASSPAYVSERKVPESKVLDDMANRLADFRAIDAFAISDSNEHESSVAELARHLTEAHVCDTPLKKIRAIFRWICYHVSYHPHAGVGLWNGADQWQSWRQRRSAKLYSSDSDEDEDDDAMHRHHTTTSEEEDTTDEEDAKHSYKNGHRRTRPSTAAAPDLKDSLFVAERILGAIERVAASRGIAMLMQALLHHAGFRSLIVSGYCKQGGYHIGDSFPHGSSSLTKTDSSNKHSSGRRAKGASLLRRATPANSSPPTALVSWSAQEEQDPADVGTQDVGDPADGLHCWLAVLVDNAADDAADHSPGSSRGTTPAWEWHLFDPTWSAGLWYERQHPHTPSRSSSAGHQRQGSGLGLGGNSPNRARASLSGDERELDGRWEKAFSESYWDVPASRLILDHFPLHCFGDPLLTGPFKFKPHLLQFLPRERIVRKEGFEKSIFPFRHFLDFQVEVVRPRKHTLHVGEPLTSIVLEVPRDVQLAVHLALHSRKFDFKKTLERCWHVASDPGGSAVKKVTIYMAFPRHGQYIVTISAKSVHREVNIFNPILQYRYYVTTGLYDIPVNKQMHIGFLQGVRPHERDAAVFAAGFTFLSPLQGYFELNTPFQIKLVAPKQTSSVVAVSNGQWQELDVEPARRGLTAFQGSLAMTEFPELLIYYKRAHKWRILSRFVTSRAVNINGDGAPKGWNRGTGVDLSVVDTNDDALQAASAANKKEDNDNFIAQYVPRADLNGRIILDSMGRCFEAQLRIDSVSTRSGKRTCELLVECSERVHLRVQLREGYGSAGSGSQGQTKTLSGNLVTVESVDLNALGTQFDSGRRNRRQSWSAGRTRGGGKTTWMTSSAFAAAQQPRSLSKSPWSARTGIYARPSTASQLPRLHRHPFALQGFRVTVRVPKAGEYTAIASISNTGFSGVYRFAFSYNFKASWN